jgi:cysteine-rich repeat protein
MRSAVASVLFLGVIGCVDPSSTTCSDGRVCPEGTTCAELVSATGDPNRCVDPAAISACSGVAALDVCDYPGLESGACYTTTQGRVCLPSGCGNFLVDKGESCDDGNANVGDGCSAACTSNETCGNGVVDPLAVTSEGTFTLDEVCDDSNLGSHDGCTSICGNEGPRWMQVDRTVPRINVGGAITFDPLRQRLVLFGGHTSTYSGCNLEIAGSVRELWESADGITWVEATPTIGPTPRRFHMIAYDGNTNRVIVFGGEAGSRLNDTWAWDGTSWTKLAPPASPSPRSESAMAYDSRRKRVVLFGGFADNPDPTSSVPVESDETWEWDGTTWQRIMTPTTPAGRHRHAMVYDPFRGVIVLAGSNNNPSALDPKVDTWEYDGTDWKQVATSTTTPKVDIMGFDTINRRAIAYAKPPAGGARSTYAWDGVSWTSLGQQQPGGGLEGASMTTDPRGRVVLYGGVTFGNPSPNCTSKKYDTWLWNGSTWAKTPPPSPSWREGAAAAYDLDLHRIVVVGGENFATGLNQTWEFDGTGWKLFDLQPWSAGRFNAVMAYDGGRKEMVLYGGQTDYSGTTLLGGTFVRSGTTWTEKFPGSSPGGRAQQAMAYDASRGQLIFFGGFIEASPYYANDTWQWDGTNWTKLTPAHAPPARGRAAIAYDPLRGNLVMFGGFGAAGVLDDTWVWDGADWIEQTPSNRPPRRQSAGLAWDPARRRLVLAAGSATTVNFDDAWEWDGNNWTEVVATTRPPGRARHVTVPTLDGSGIYIMGGLYEPGEPFDTWQLRWEAPGAYEYCAMPADNDGDSLRGCADVDCWATCTPLCLPGTTCDASAPRCGDGMCNPTLENCRNCVEDCPTCAAFCGDTFCDSGENTSSCPGDCP